MGRLNDFYFQFRKKLLYKRIGYNSNVMRKFACLVFNQVMVDNYAAFFYCTPVGRASDSMIEPDKAIHFNWLGLKLLVCCLAHRASTGVFFFFLHRVSVSYSASGPGISIVGQRTESVSPRF